MSKTPSFNTELEPGDVTIYGTVVTAERVGTSVKLTTRESETATYISESGTSSVYTDADADRLRALNGWQ